MLLGNYKSQGTVLVGSLSLTCPERNTVEKSRGGGLSDLLPPATNINEEKKEKNMGFTIFSLLSAEHH